MCAVCVLGGGTMSPGIATAFASRGHEVRIWTRSPERATAAVLRAREMLNFLAANELAPGTPARLNAALSLGQLADAELIIEAIAEDLDAKRRLLRLVETVCDAGALIATNTSGLRVTDIAHGLGRPDRVVAMHFWNPAHLMPLVEVTGGELGSPASVDHAVRLIRAIGKLPVVLERDVLGFLGTRMQQAVVREAIALLEAGVASAESIDLAVRASFGIRFPVLGPLETTDLSGLDVIQSIHSYLLRDLNASVAPQSALTERVARGDLGVKSGQGFHDWSVRDADAVIRRRDEELVRRLRLLAEQGALGDGNAIAS
jgi:3-hydroxybutyryl-CoA dehydrogenase